MCKAYHWGLGVSWVLGVICMVASIVLKLLPSLEARIELAPRDGIVLAAVFFLSALASAVAGRTPPAS